MSRSEGAQISAKARSWMLGGQDDPTPALIGAGAKGATLGSTKIGAEAEASRIEDSGQMLANSSVVGWDGGGSMTTSFVLRARLVEGLVAPTTTLYLPLQQHMPPQQICFETQPYLQRREK